MLNRIWNDESGVLTFEWILLLTVLVIGIVGALSAVRDAINTELGDVATAMISLDQSYYICNPWEVMVPDDNVFDGATWSYFLDGATSAEGRFLKDGTTENGGKKPNQYDSGGKAFAVLPTEGLDVAGETF
ncbi:MAG: hypothetical protein Q4D38_05255 [Planctomycetia bacterium]|nr:hypothetical protein [Planctomycetia bacterium]